MEKVAVVTGASSNIGRGVAKVLAKYGYTLAITYRTNPEGAEETANDIRAEGGVCHVYQASLEEPDVPAKVIDKIHEDLGRIDVLVNNAGRDIRSSVLEVTADDIDALYKSNFRNYTLCTGAAARHMVRDGIKGSIILITSSRAERAYPEDFLYGGLKAAVKRACESMALDLSAYGIRVNCVAPGATSDGRNRKGRPPRKPVTPEHWINEVPIKRYGTPREIGEACAFLADNDKSGYITGITLRVDGGLILPGMREGFAPVPWVSDGWHERHYAAVMDSKDEE